MNPLAISARGKISRSIPLPIIVVVSLMVICGCGEKYGTLQRSEEVTEIFKTYRALPDHRYFFVGPEGRPDAIMGIQADYTLQTTQWTSFDAAGDSLKKWVDIINFYNRTRVRNYPYGFHILDPEGQQVGIWYSIWDWTTIIMEDDNRISIFPPAKEDPFADGNDLDKMKMD